MRLIKPGLLAICLSVAVQCGLAEARQCQSVDLPDRVQAGDSMLALNGLGLRQATILRVPVYVAALYMKTLSHDPNAILASGNPFQLLLAFVRDVGAADIREGWNDGFARNSMAQLPALRDRIQMLNGWMTNISSGQRMTFTFKPGAGVAVDVNGVPKGTIKGDDFAKAFLAIWLGPEPPNASVKSGMLGGQCA